MGIRDEVTTDLAEEFDGDLADAVRSFTGERTVTSGEYDPIAGEYPPADAINYSGRGVFDGYTSYEVDGQHVLATDVKLICLQDETIDDQGQKIRPRVDDTIAGYLVKDVGNDPTEAIFIIQLRSTTSG